MGELDTKLTALADAIRAKTGVTGNLSLDDMASAVTSYVDSGVPSDVGFMQRSVVDFVVPSSVTCIGTGAFQECTLLKSITIPSSVTSISSSAFYHCTSLTDIYCGFAENAVSGAPWGAPNTATIHYNS